MRAMPNMHVYSPADPYELRAVMNWMANNKQPMYMQLIRHQVDAIFDESCTFDPTRAVQLRSGSDVTLVTTGYMTHFALKAADTLAAQGVSVDLLHYPSVKPFDEKSLIASAQRTGSVVTVENQSIIGGLGGAVCEVLSGNYPVPVKRLGVPDSFGEVATEEYLFAKHGFGPAEIAAACSQMAAKKKGAQ